MADRSGGEDGEGSGTTTGVSPRRPEATASERSGGGVRIGDRTHGAADRARCGWPAGGRQRWALGSARGRPGHRCRTAGRGRCWLRGGRRGAGGATWGGWGWVSSRRVREGKWAEIELDKPAGRRRQRHRAVGKPGLVGRWLAALAGEAKGATWRVRDRRLSARLLSFAALGGGEGRELVLAAAARLGGAIRAARARAGADRSSKRRQQLSSPASPSDTGQHDPNPLAALARSPLAALSPASSGDVRRPATDGSAHPAARSLRRGFPRLAPASTHVGQLPRPDPQTNQQQPALETSSPSPISSLPPSSARGPAPTHAQTAPFDASLPHPHAHAAAAAGAAPRPPIRRRPPGRPAARRAAACPLSSTEPPAGAATPSATASAAAADDLPAAARAGPPDRQPVAARLANIGRPAAARPDGRPAPAADGRALRGPQAVHARGARPARDARRAVRRRPVDARLHVPQEADARTPAVRPPFRSLLDRPPSDDRQRPDADSRPSTLATTCPCRLQDEIVTQVLAESHAEECRFCHSSSSSPATADRPTTPINDSNDITLDNGRSAVRRPKKPVALFTSGGMGAGKGHVLRTFLENGSIRLDDDFVWCASSTPARVTAKAARR